jgi:hypothetical protein
MAGCRAVPALALTLMFWLVEHIQGGPGVHGQVHGRHRGVQGRPGVHGQVHGHHGGVQGRPGVLGKVNGCHRGVLGGLGVHGQVHGRQRGSGGVRGARTGTLRGGITLRPLSFCTRLFCPGHFVH